MSLWRQLTHGLRGLMRQAEKNQEVGEEVQHYFEEATAVWKSRGLSAEDAEASSAAGTGEHDRRSRNRCVRMDGRMW